MGEPVQSLLYRHTLSKVDQSQPTTQRGAGSEAGSDTSAEYSCVQQASSETDNRGATSQKTYSALIKTCEYCEYLTATQKLKTAVPYTGLSFKLIAVSLVRDYSSRETT